MAVAVDQEISYQIRAAIAQALAAIPGLQTSPYLLSDPTPPSAAVMRGPVDYDQAMGGGTHTWTFIVRLYVAMASDIGAQMLLDSYLSPTGTQSVKAAIETDTSLGGIIAALHVTSATGEQEIPRDSGGPMLGSEFTVEVWL